MSKTRTTLQASKPQPKPNSQTTVKLIHPRRMTAGRGIVIGSQMTFRINKGLKSFDNVFAISGASSSSSSGRKGKGQLEKAPRSLTEVLPHVLMDKLNPDISERKPLAAPMFQSRRGGRAEERYDLTAAPALRELHSLFSFFFFPKDRKS